MYIPTHTYLHYIYIYICYVCIYTCTHVFTHTLSHTKIRAEAEMNGFFYYYYFKNNRPKRRSRGSKRSSTTVRSPRNRLSSASKQVTKPHFKLNLKMITSTAIVETHTLTHSLFIASCLDCYISLLSCFDSVSHSFHCLHSLSLSLSHTHTQVETTSVS
jgi:hypothetical protein